MTGKYPTECMSCGWDVERGGWWGQQPQNTDVTAKEPAGQAKREREPLTGPGQRDAGHCWPLLRALRSGVLRKAWRPRPRELGRHLPELTQERALLVLPTQRTGARGSSADAAGHVASRATPVSVLRSCSGPPFPLTWKESSVMGSSARAGFQKDQKKKKKKPVCSPLRGQSQAAGQGATSGLPCEAQSRASASPLSSGEH